ncbi:hypothetical protein EV215_1655 [Hypnocyclicus thermotrophus]|uniref:Uncharacterized protein n=1 Tax=Hypnocyclicus thermotrophus TaxID=1627895 RepID=A0AA46I549_9FUSO|nr:hypothetical protein [Hypnocyclicus thermotrophus]TDT68588.1 hypothetical protein EV215_1655 [Hypnocyclicus thermotrophus]
MKKALFFLILIIVGCSREIILRKEPLEKVPFKSELKNTGNVIKIFYIEYPKTINEKNKFWTEFSNISKKLIATQEKRNIILTKEFFDDLKILTQEKIFKEEKIFIKIASDLTEEEKKELVKYFKESEKETVDDYLKLQIKYWLTRLHKIGEFKEEKIYNEKIKNDLILEVIEKRKEQLKYIINANYNYIAKLDNINVDSKIYFNDKNVNIEYESILKNQISKYEYVYITNLTEDIIEKIYNKIIKLDKNIIISNAKYKGYIYNDKFVFFVNGEKTVKEYNEYNVFIEIKSSSLKELLKYKNLITLNEFLKGEK